MALRLLFLPCVFCSSHLGLEQSEDEKTTRARHKVKLFLGEFFLLVCEVRSRHEPHVLLSTSSQTLFLRCLSPVVLNLLPALVFFVLVRRIYLLLRGLARFIRLDL